MFTENQLRQYANKFLGDTYGMKLTVPLTLNGRLRKTCGWFKSSSTTNRYTGEVVSKKAVGIELNKFFVQNNEATVVLDVLRHELVHYALFMQNKPNSDGHPVFERELKRLGIVSQSTIDKYNITSKPVRVSIYQCADCDKQYKRQRALPNGGRNHRCHCGGNLRDLGKRVVQVS